MKKKTQIPEYCIPSLKGLMRIICEQLINEKPLNSLKKRGKKLKNLRLVKNLLT